LEQPKKRGSGFWNTGTTTLLGAVICKLADEGGVSKGDDGNWGLLCVNVGDCKAFCFSKKKQKFMEVTQYSRPNESDMSDPGGRLGPASKEGGPDLRNLGIYFAQVKAGDIVVLLSDGVYDNFDPEFLGYQPSDLNLEFSSWKEAAVKEGLGDVKQKYRNELLTKVVCKSSDDGSDDDSDSHSDGEDKKKKKERQRQY